MKSCNEMNSAVNDYCLLDFVSCKFAWFVIHSSSSSSSSSSSEHGRHSAGSAPGTVLSTASRHSQPNLSSSQYQSFGMLLLLRILDGCLYILLLQTQLLEKKKKHSVVFHYIFGCFWHILAVFGYHQLDVTIYMG